MIYLRMTIACAIFTLFGGFIYFKNRRLPLLSTKIFIALFITILFYFLFDGITIYTVNHLEVVNGELVDHTWNYVAHIIYLILIDAVIFLFSLYVIYHTDIHRETNKLQLFLNSLPFIISSIFIIFLPIEYIKDEINYSRGPKAYALYASVGCYIGIILYKTVRYWKNINSEKAYSIVLSLCVFGIISIIQMIFPTMLISSIGAGLFVLSIVLSSENPEKYIDEETDFYNDRVFCLVAEDWLKYKSHFVVLTISLEQFIYFNKLKTQILAIYKDISSELKREFNEYCYAIHDECFAVLLPNSNKVEAIENKIKQILSRYRFVGEESIPSLVIDVDSSQYHLKKIEEEIVRFLTKLDDDYISIDSLSGVRNRNAFEREFLLFNDRSSNKWIIILDINHFKEINDTYGHSFGDQAIKQFAQLLKENFPKYNQVYRVGGDEFVIFFEGDKESLDAILEYTYQNSLKLELPFELSFAYGYACLETENPYQQADQNMYQQKMAVETK